MTVADPNRQRSVGEIEEISGADLLDRHRKVRRLHKIAKGLSEGPVGFGRPKNLKIRYRVEQLRKEWQSLHVIPMEMAEQHRAVEGLLS